MSLGRLPGWFASSLSRASISSTSTWERTIRCCLRTEETERLEKLLADHGVRVLQPGDLGS